MSGQNVVRVYIDGRLVGVVVDEDRARKLLGLIALRRVERGESVVDRAFMYGISIVRACHEGLITYGIRGGGVMGKVKIICEPIPKNGTEAWLVAVASGGSITERYTYALEAHAVQKRKELIKKHNLAGYYVRSSTAYKAA